MAMTGLPHPTICAYTRSTGVYREVAYEARTDSGLGDLDCGNEGVLVKVRGGVSEVIVRRLAIKGVDVARERDSEQRQHASEG